VQCGNVVDRRDPVEVVLTLKGPNVLSKIQSRHGQPLARSGLLLEPVAEDELKVEHEQSGQQENSILEVHLMLEPRLNTLEPVKHGTPVHGNRVLVYTQGTQEAKCTP
jgi:hypothetical protein